MPPLRAHVLGRSAFLGPVFESFVAAEIAKAQLNAGRARALYYFRGQQGLEVDFVVPAGPAALALIEAKASRMVVPADVRSLERLAAAVSGYATRSAPASPPDALRQSPHAALRQDLHSAKSR